MKTARFASDWTLDRGLADTTASERDDPESLLCAEPAPACLYHRDDGASLASSTGWAARVVAGEVLLYRVGRRGRPYRRTCAEGHRLVRLALDDTGAGSVWALVDADRALVAWLVGVPPGESWQTDAGWVVGTTEGFVRL